MTNDQTKKDMTQELTITITPGLEPILAQELTSLGYTPLKTGYGSVSVLPKTFSDIYKLNFSLRTATRILLPLLHFSCKNQYDLYDAVYSINWAPFFSKSQTFAIDAIVHANQNLTNSHFVALKAKDAICDKLRSLSRRRPTIDVKFPDLQIHIHIFNTEATLSFDTSGHALHERGYRRRGSIAPMRENFAAALLMLAGYTPQHILVDPCCGSGTFLIEAALMASNTPPQFLRSKFGFMAHPNYSDIEWNKMRATLLSERKPLQSTIMGIEQDPAAFDILSQSVAKAGFEHKIKLIQGDFQTATLPVAPTFVITNPPYGIRLGDTATLEPLYIALGDFMKQKTAKPAHGAIFTASLELAKSIGLKTERKTEIHNANLDCRLLEYELY